MDNKTTLDYLKGAYPNVFEGCTEVRILDLVPGLPGSVLEIIYSNDKIRNIVWADRTDLHRELHRLEENI